MFKLNSTSFFCSTETFEILHVVDLHEHLFISIFQIFIQMILRIAFFYILCSWNVRNFLSQSIHKRPPLSIHPFPTISPGTFFKSIFFSTAYQTSSFSLFNISLFFSSFRWLEIPLRMFYSIMRSKDPFLLQTLEKRSELGTHIRYPCKNILSS